MKKINTLLLSTACALTINNASGMLIKQALCPKKIRSFSTHNKELAAMQRVQVVMDRHTIKAKNSILEKQNTLLMGCITEQNKVLDQIEKWSNKPRTQMEYALEEHEMTALAQRLLELQQYKNALLS